MNRFDSILFPASSEDLLLRIRNKEYLTKLFRSLKGLRDELLQILHDAKLDEDVLLNLMKKRLSCHLASASENYYQVPKVTEYTFESSRQSNRHLVIEMKKIEEESLILLSIRLYEVGEDRNASLNTKMEGSRILTHCVVGKTSYYASCHLIDGEDKPLVEVRNSSSVYRVSEMKVYKLECKKKEEEEKKESFASHLRRMISGFF